MDSNTSRYCCVARCYNSITVPSVEKTHFFLHSPIYTTVLDRLVLCRSMQYSIPTNNCRPRKTQTKAVLLPRPSFYSPPWRFTVHSFIHSFHIDTRFIYSSACFASGLIPSLALQQHRVALQRQKREQDLKEQRELERQSPAKKKSGSTGAGGSGGASGPGGGSGTAASSNSSGSAASSLLCARKSNKRKRLSSPFKKGT